MIEKETLFQFTYGLYVLTTNGKKDNGCIINTAMQVTDEPKQMLVAVNKNTLTHDLLLESGKLCISIIAGDADLDIYKRFGFESGKTTDKFQNFEKAKRAENGVYYITEGTCGYVTGTVFHTVDVGTHTVFFAKIEEAKVLRQFPGATYDDYQKLIKKNF